MQLVGRIGRGLGHGIGKFVAWADELNRAFDGGIVRLLGLVGLIVVGGSVIYIITVSLPALPSVSVASGTAVPPTITPTVLLRHARVVQIGKIGLVVRATPAGQRIGKLADGTTIEVIAGPATLANTDHPSWWQIRHGNLVGWVSGTFLSFED